MNKLARLGTAALVAAPILTGCAKEIVYRPYPNMQGNLPNTPGAIIHQTTNAAKGALMCLQTPPDIVIETSTAAKSCFLGGDVPAKANCGGYQFEAVCHQPTFNGGFACAGVKSATCNGVTVIGQRGPVRVSSGRIPARVTVPVPGNSPATPWAIPGLPQGIPGLGQNNLPIPPIFHANN